MDYMKKCGWSSIISVKLSCSAQCIHEGKMEKKKHITSISKPMLFSAWLKIKIQATMEISSDLQGIGSAGTLKIVSSGPGLSGN